MNDYLKIAGKRFTSRLIIGTGKYSSMEDMVKCIDSAGAEVVTVAIRRLDLDNPNEKTILDYIDWTRYTILPNTAGCRTADPAAATEVRYSAWCRTPLTAPGYRHAHPRD